MTQTLLATALPPFGLAPAMPHTGVQEYDAITLRTRFAF